MFRGGWLSLGGRLSGLRGGCSGCGLLPRGLLRLLRLA